MSFCFLYVLRFLLFRGFNNGFNVCVSYICSDKADKGNTK